MSLGREARELLSRRDPHGYYVIPAKDEAEQLVKGQGIVIVRLGEGILIKTRSRSLAMKMLRTLHKRGLLLTEEDME